MRGRRPTPLHLRLVEGTLRPARHGDRTKVREQIERAAHAFGRLDKPKGLKHGAGRAWDRWIAPATWLDGAREPAAIAFCLLWQEFEEAPRLFPAAKHSQMRGLMADLGLSDARRRGRQEPAQPEQERFFDDE